MKDATKSRASAVCELMLQDLAKVPEDDALDYLRIIGDFVDELGEEVIWNEGGRKSIPEPELPRDDGLHAVRAMEIHYWVDTYDIPVNSNIVAFTGGFSLRVWYVCPYADNSLNNDLKETRRLKVFGSNIPIPAGYEYIATASLDRGTTWHLFEKIR